MVCSAEELLETIDARLTASPRAALSQMAQELGVSRRTIVRLLWMARNTSYRSYQQSVLLRIALERLQHDRA
jgi:AraC-like DNA-binding protein